MPNQELLKLNFPVLLIILNTLDRFLKETLIAYFSREIDIAKEAFYKKYHLDKQVLIRLRKRLIRSYIWSTGCRGQRHEH